MHKRIFLLLAFSLLVSLCQGQIYPREDTLYIPETPVIPAIDGSIGAEWELAPWHPIDQIWMPWNNDPDNLNQADGLQLWEGPEDFTGNFKVMWSSETNLLYFLVEIIDDVFVDGYVYHENPSQGGGYPNYDIVEVFIDEDRSGGLHVFDGTGSVGQNWGTNAENAFAYHLAANALEDGEVQTEFHALDIAGTNWGYPNQIIADYASHFPEFALVRDGNTFIWEFSLLVHDDTYDDDNQEASVVTLEEGKIMGLSMAYCDNDDPDANPLRRHHFFGSVEVPLHAHNSHWMDADWFGVAKLVDEGGVSAETLLRMDNFSVNVFFANNNLHFQGYSGESGTVNVRVFDITGVSKGSFVLQKSQGNWNSEIPFTVVPGMYLAEITQGRYRKVIKIIVK